MQYQTFMRDYSHVYERYSVREAISSLGEFGRAAGTKLNITKCEGLWTGSSKK